MRNSSLGLLYQDELENPQTAEPFTGELARLWERARACLYGRTDLQIAMIAGFADSYASDNIAAGVLSHRLSDGQIPATPENVTPEHTVSLAKFVCDALRDEGPFDLSLFDREGQPMDPVEDFTAGDVFAALALVECERAFRAGNDVAHAIRAAELITLAEMEITASTNIVWRSNENRTASFARWDRWSRAKKRAREIYASRNWSSRAAAIRFMKDEIASIVRNDTGELMRNPERTIGGWLKP